MWRRGKSSETDQASVSLRETELEEPTRKDQEEFIGKGRTMDDNSPRSEGNRGNPEDRNPRRRPPAEGLHEVKGESS